VPRSVEHLDGLALAGRASVGSVPLAPPALLESRPAAAGERGVFLTHRPAPPGSRTLVLSDGGSELELRVPILAPEVVGTEPGVHRVGEHAVLLHSPFDAGTAAALRSSRPELVLLGNARALWNEGLPFVRAVRDVRSAIGAAPLLWAPRVALPHRIPFLVYVGVDLLDTTEGLLRSAEGEYLDPALGALPRADALAERLCDCPACASDPPGPLEAHTAATYRRAIAETRAALRAGRLRELVEARLVAEPALAELLRYADRDLARPLEERTPVVADDARDYVLAEAHRRPEMVRFRERLIERYRPPPSKTVLLLVPCSKTKPYRRSRSHRRLLGALEGVRPLERVHVVSVSSPIGLVPQELEDLFPARHYDIPVTGDWSEPERETVRTSLGHLRRHGAYRSVLVHLDPEEYRFLAGDLPEGEGVRWTLTDDRTTSPDALRRLRGAVEEALASAASVPGGPLAVVREELREVASVQFGRAAADRLFTAPVRLAGRPWFQRVTDGRTDLATLREERGLFHLTVAGARRLAPSFPLAVEVDPTLPLTGDLFVPGVRSADPAIRRGDSVVLLREGALAGVGEAALPGPLMTELERGIAVRVRHREHRPTDTPMTGEGSPPGDHGPVV
jgi:archaeosine synthase alpha-subunit